MKETEFEANSEVAPAINPADRADLLSEEEKIVVQAVGQLEAQVLDLTAQFCAMASQSVTVATCVTTLERKFKKFKRDATTALVISLVAAASAGFLAAYVFFR